MAWHPPTRRLPASRSATTCTCRCAPVCRPAAIAPAWSTCTENMMCDSPAFKDGLRRGLFVMVRPVPPMSLVVFASLTLKGGGTKPMWVHLLSSKWPGAWARRLFWHCPGAAHQRRRAEHGHAPPMHLQTESACCDHWQADTCPSHLEPSVVRTPNEATPEEQMLCSQGALVASAPKHHCRRRFGHRRCHRRYFCTGRLPE